MAKTAISPAMGVGKSRKASELRRNLLGGPSALLVDPLGFDAGDSNLYRYVNNGPSIATDPSGKDYPTGSDPVERRERAARKKEKELKPNWDNPPPAGNVWTFQRMAKGSVCCLPHKVLVIRYPGDQVKTYSYAGIWDVDKADRSFVRKYTVYALVLENQLSLVPGITGKDIERVFPAVERQTNGEGFAIARGDKGYGLFGNNCQATVNYLIEQARLSAEMIAKSNLKLPANFPIFPEKSWWDRNKDLGDAMNSKSFADRYSGWNGVVPANPWARYEK
jgi:hypothetical protein